MRTTLDIEDDVLLAAKELARHSGCSAGQVISRLARQALTQSPLGSRQVTDAYLLALAVEMKGCLATLDRSVPLHTVRGAKARHLVVI